MPRGFMNKKRLNIVVLTRQERKASSKVDLDFSAVWFSNKRCIFRGVPQ